MRKKNDPEKEKFWKKVKFIRSDGTPNPHFWRTQTSSVAIMFDGQKMGTFYSCPPDKYLRLKKGQRVFKIVDAISKQNEIVLKIRLENPLGKIEKDFSKIIHIALNELKEAKRPIMKHTAIEFDNYLEAYKLRSKDPKKWTFIKIGQKLFPGDFKDRTGEGGKIESAIHKARRFYLKGKEIIEG